MVLIMQALLEFYYFSSHLCYFRYASKGFTYVISSYSLTSFFPPLGMVLNYQARVPVLFAVYSLSSNFCCFLICIGFLGHISSKLSFLSSRNLIDFAPCLAFFSLSSQFRYASKGWFCDLSVVSSYSLSSSSIYPSANSNSWNNGSNCSVQAFARSSDLLLPFKGFA